MTLLTTRAKLPQFETLLAQEKSAEISKLAHSIKGAAAMIFAEELARVTLNLELAAKRGDEAAKLTELVKQVLDQFGKLSDSVPELLSKS